MLTDFQQVIGAQRERSVSKPLVSDGPDEELAHTLDWGLCLHSSGRIPQPAEVLLPQRPHLLWSRIAHRAV